jgi:predicted RNA-binding protein YlqC (UPF0109 family)
MNDQAYLDTLLRGIVLYPEQMRLQRIEDARGILFRIHLAKSDMPLVIGKTGQSVHTIRWLMNTGDRANQETSF